MRLIHLREDAGASHTSPAPEDHDRQLHGDNRTCSHPLCGERGRAPSRSLGPFSLHEPAVTPLYVKHHFRHEHDAHKSRPTTHCMADPRPQHRALEHFPQREEPGVHVVSERLTEAQCVVQSELAVSCREFLVMLRVSYHSVKPGRTCYIAESHQATRTLIPQSQISSPQGAP